MEAVHSYELTLLLGLGFRAVIDDLHTHLAKLGYDDVRPAHGFAFVRLTPHGATGNELAYFLDISKQAASSMVDYLAEHGYVVRQPHPTDRRGKLIMLTARGYGCIQETEAFLSQLETRWATLLGAQRMDELRSDLRRLVTAANGGTMPQKFRPTW